MELHTIGIDLGKTIFHLVGLNQRGEVVGAKRSSHANNCCTRDRSFSAYFSLFHPYEVREPVDFLRGIIRSFE
jgi:hypothetical protein